MKHNANPEKEKVVTGNDCIAIVKYGSGLPGGRTLDFSNITDEFVPAGTIVVKTTEGVYAPLKWTAEAKYEALPSGAKYVGLTATTVTKKDPRASVMIDGVANSAVIPAMADATLTAFKAAVPAIIFIQDEEA